jgi:hypothetical protein
VALYFLYAFLAAGALNFICSILVLRGMAAADIKVSFFEIRWQVHKHLKAYRQITLDKTGKVAWPYYGYKSSLVGMAGFAILTLLSLKQ